MHVPGLRKTNTNPSSALAHWRDLDCQLPTFGCPREPPLRQLVVFTCLLGTPLERATTERTGRKRVWAEGNLNHKI